jgi:hypothetical protein
MVAEGMERAPRRRMVKGASISRDGVFSFVLSVGCATDAGYYFTISPSPAGRLSLLSRGISFKLKGTVLAKIFLIEMS